MSEYLSFLTDTSSNSLDQNLLVLFFSIISVAFAVQVIFEQEKHSNQVTILKSEAIHRFINVYTVVNGLSFIAVPVALFFINATALMYAVMLFAVINYAVSAVIENVWTGFVHRKLDRNYRNQMMAFKQLV